MLAQRRRRWANIGPALGQQITYRLCWVVIILWHAKLHVEHDQRSKEWGPPSMSKGKYYLLNKGPYILFANFLHEID